MLLLLISGVKQLIMKEIKTEFMSGVRCDSCVFGINIHRFTTFIDGKQTKKQDMCMKCIEHFRFGAVGETARAIDEILSQVQKI